MSCVIKPLLLLWPLVYRALSICLPFMVPDCTRKSGLVSRVFLSYIHVDVKQNVGLADVCSLLNDSAICEIFRASVGSGALVLVKMYSGHARRAR